MVQLADHQQDYYHTHNGNGQIDNHILNKGCQNVVCEAHDGHRHGVGQLSRHVVEVVALGAGGRHDRGVGDGRAVVAHNRAAQSGSDGDHQQVVVQVTHGQIHSRSTAGEHRDDDGQQDGEGAPGGTGGETQERGDDEHYGGQQGIQAAAEVLHNAGHELGGAEALGHVADSPGQAQDQDGGHHLLEALGQAVHQFGELHGAAHHEINHVDDQGDQRAQRQGIKGGGVGKGGDEVMAAVLEAHIDHGGHTADDQDDNGNDQVDDLAIGIKLHLSGILKGTLRRGIEVALGGVELVGAHGAVIDVEAGHHNDEHQGQDGVVVEGDGPQEDLEADLLIADYAGNGRRPGGDGHHDTHRGAAVESIM